MGRTAKIPMLPGRAVTASRPVAAQLAECNVSGPAVAGQCGAVPGERGSARSCAARLVATQASQGTMHAFAPFCPRGSCACECMVQRGRSFRGVLGARDRRSAAPAGRPFSKPPGLVGWNDERVDRRLRLEHVSRPLLGLQRPSPPKRLQNVSTTVGELGGFGWTAVNESERRNRLHLKRLEPEVQRHQLFGKGPFSEFESLRPSQCAARGAFGWSPRESGTSQLAPLALVANRQRIPASQPTLQVQVSQLVSIDRRCLA